MAADHPNHILASLPPEDFEFLRPHLKPFDLTQGDLLFDAGQPVTWV